MALTLDRWLAAVIAGSLVAVVLVSGEWGTPERRRYGGEARQILAAREQVAGSAVRVATERLHSKTLRDSVITALARLPRHNGVRLVVSEQLANQAQVSRALNARVAGSLLQPFVGGVDMVVPADTWSRSFTQSSGNLHLLPTGASERCVSISGAPGLPRNIATRDWVGPCGFYAVYGVPGPNIDRWLKSGAWIYGLRWRGVVPNRGYGEYGNRWYVEGAPWGESAGMRVRAYLSTEGFSCLAGNGPACRTLVLDPRNSDYGGQYWSGLRAFRDAVRLDESSVWSRPNYLTYVGLLGPQMPSLLSDMAIALGPDKFTRFWKSDLPPADAFRAASGQEIEVWTQGWMRARYGEFERGPGVSLGSAALGVLLALLALGGASVTWRRRQVA